MNDTLTKIENFILQAQQLGYGEMEFTISIHDYQARKIEMKATENEKESAVSISKRMVIDKKLDKAKK